MKYSTRIKELLKTPSYRVRLGFFIVTGLMFIAISLLISNTAVQNLTLNFATTFMAVGLISFMWDFLGGDPIEIRVSENFGELGSKIESLKLSSKILSDIAENNIGIERIWSSRRDWDNDTFDGLNEWQKRVCKARDIAIVSNTFWARWFDDDEFRKLFFKNIETGAKIKLLIYDPNSEILTLRAKDEKDPRSKWGLQMQNEIISTLHSISEELDRMTHLNRSNIEVRLTDKSYHLAQIIKADSKILISTYLSGKSGSPSPTFQIIEPSRFFTTYLEQINILWEKGKIFSPNEIKQIIKEI